MCGDASPVGNACDEFILPPYFSFSLLEGIHMTHPIGATPAVCAYGNQVISNQRISMKAGLVPVFLDVIAPPYRTQRDLYTTCKRRRRAQACDCQSSACGAVESLHAGAPKRLRGR